MHEQDGVPWLRILRSASISTVCDKSARPRLSRRSKRLDWVLSFALTWTISDSHGTTIGEVGRDFMAQYCICPPRENLFSSILLYLQENRLSLDRETGWSPIRILKGALPPATNLQGKFAQQVKRVLTDYGVEKEPLGIDFMEFPMERALEKEGIILTRWNAGHARCERD